MGLRPIRQIPSWRANASERGNLGVNIGDYAQPRQFPSWRGVSPWQSTSILPHLSFPSSVIARHEVPRQSILIGGVAASKMRNQTDSNRTRHCEEGTQCLTRQSTIIRTATLNHTPSLRGSIRRIRLWQSTSLGGKAASIFTGSPRWE